MNDNSPYNSNPELVSMKEDVAKRKVALAFKSMLITGAFVLAGVALATVALPALIPGMAGGLMAGYIGGIIGAAVGGRVANFMTMQDREKLKIDEQYVDTYMQGKNHWGKGYREEVAEHGYSMMGPAPTSGLPPHVGKDVANQR